MDRMKLWPHGTLIILVGAIIAAVGALLFTRYERTASAKEAPLAARVERVDGQVGLNRSLDQSQNAQWVEATATDGGRHRDGRAHGSVRVVTLAPGHGRAS